MKSPEAAAVDEIVGAINTKLLATLPVGVTVLVREGWPDDMERLAAGPMVCVTNGSTVSEATTPWSERQTAGADDVVVLYGVERWMCAAQVDVFALSKLARDELVPLVRAALSSPPTSARAFLTMADYHGLQVAVKVTGASDSDPTSVVPGRWRATLDLDLSGGVVASVTWVKAKQIDVSDGSAVILTVE